MLYTVGAVAVLDPPRRQEIHLMRTRFLIVPFVVLPLVLGGCSGVGTGVAAPVPMGVVDERPLRDGGTLTVGLSTDPDPLDPTTTGSFYAREVFASMCEKLYDVNADLNFVPQLATALPELSPDGKTATIRLRTDVKFNDGTPFDAAAVKKSLDRHRTLDKSARKSELAAVSDITVVDPSTVRLTLSRPYAPLTAQLSDRAGMVMSPAALDRYGDNFGAHPVCVGPFKFVSRTSGSEIVLARSDDYYDRSKVKLDKIIYRIIVNPNVRAANLQSGDIQAAEQVATSTVTGLQADSKTRVVAGGGLGYMGIVINVGNTNGSTAPPGPVDTPLAQHPELRQALELSLSRDVINKVVFNGLSVPDCSPLPTQSPYRQPDLQCPKRDLARAKELVAQSGVRTPVPVALMVSPGGTFERVGQVIQAMAKDAGFDVQLRPIEAATASAQSRAGKFDTYLFGWSGRTDPDGNTTGLITSGGALNYGGLHDPAIDQAVKQAAATLDTATRRKFYTQALNRQSELQSVIYLYHERYFLGMTKDIAGVQFYADGIPRFTTAGYAR
jgi:peptide/nickel transport system substrate-binding protein